MFDWFFEGAEEVLLLALNGLILALGTIVGGFLSILPDMPALPTLPDPFTTAAAWVAWFFPVDTLLTVLALVITLWLVWQLVVVALRWAKAVSE